MAKILILGSCRVMTLMKKSCYQDVTNWKSLGYSYSIDEQINIIKILQGDRPIRVVRYMDRHKLKFETKGAEEDCLQTTETSEISQLYTDNLSYLREHYPDLELIITEIGTLKTYFWRGEVINAGIDEKIGLEVKVATKEEMRNKILSLVKLWDKKIIFVSHFLHENIPNRQLIYDAIEDVCKMYPQQCRLFTPSDFWKNGNKEEYLQSDGVHYLLNANLKPISDQLDQLISDMEKGTLCG